MKTAQELLKAATDIKGYVRSDFQVSVKRSWSEGNEAHTGDAWDLDVVDDDERVQCGPHSDLFLVLGEDADAADEIWAVSERSGYGVDVTAVIRELVGN